jgi:hypothetical protein
MVRPQFPPIYCESQMPDVNSILEVVVIVDDVWKVGDLVDWLMDHCYWSGRVTELLGDEHVKVIFMCLSIYILYLVLNAEFCLLVIIFFHCEMVSAYVFLVYPVNHTPLFMYNQLLSYFVC